MKTPPSGRIGLTQYLQNGTLDGSFGSSGFVSSDLGLGDAVAYSLAMDGAGNILVAGETDSTGSNDLIIARFSSNGVLDTAFGPSGGFLQYGAANGESARSIKMTSGGRILTLGTVTQGLTSDFILMKLTSSGQLDNSFGPNGNGTVLTSFDFDDDHGTDIAVQSSDGKIIVGGYSYNGSNYDFALARFDDQGILDTSFSSDGLLTYDFAGGDDYGFDIEVQNDGKILAAGYSYNGSSSELALVRFNSDGSVDSSFGQSGSVKLAVQGTDTKITSMKIVANGKIVLSGYRDNGGQFQFTLARFWH